MLYRDRRNFARQEADLEPLKSWLRGEAGLEALRDWLRNRPET